MQTIDLTTWERTPYFKNYQNVDLPYIIVGCLTPKNAQSQ